jgi:hypothetical protein
MTPFHTRFPELGPRETRCFHVVTADGPLPLGEYGLAEYYCEDPGCDCRRVLIRVTTPQAPNTALATINYGWESRQFYTDWMHGDTEAGREITDASLDPLHTQSAYADRLLELFRGLVRNDPAYVARLARHYEMFKHAPGYQPHQPHQPNIPVASAPTTAPAMSIPGILGQLQRVPNQADFAPYEAALRAAIEQRETIVPELIAAIDRVSANPTHYLADREDCLHLFAIYLLAQFRERRALDCFLRFFSLPGDQALDLTGDMVTGQGAAVLASVCGGDPLPLLRLAHDHAVNPFVRTQAIDALAVQSLWGERPREAAVEELRRLFHTLAKPGSSHVWAGLICTICDFHVPELVDEARQAFTQGLVDDTIIHLGNLEADLSQPEDLTLDGFRARNAPIDAITECSAWLCFRDPNEDAGPWEEEDDIDPADLPDDACGLSPGELPEFPKPLPYLAPSKPGRNDPCPCGSGKKYKKCCGKN